MPITTVARTHLIYQFIILSLLLFGINYYELAADRKFILFLGCLPIFLYQLMIVSCCTELLPVPRWMNSNLCLEMESKEENTEIEPLGNAAEVPIQLASPKTSSMSTICCGHCKDIPRVKTCRKWNKGDMEAQHLSPENTSNRTTGKSESISGNIVSESESTKTYFFPYPQKRMEQWIESKENVRPYKLRSLEKNSDNSASTAQPDSSTLEDIPTGAPEVTLDTSLVVEETELEKSYSFPFRQKRFNQWAESKEWDDPPSSPSTPYWKTLGYSVAVKQEARRRRRSISSSQLPRWEEETSPASERHREFSQSVEIPSTPTTFNTNFRRSTSKLPMTTLSKIKLGFSNCLLKMRKENRRSEKSQENRKFSIKSYFQPREKVDLETPIIANKNSSGIINSNENKPHFYPSYIPYEKQRFEKDVQKRLSQLPRM